MKRLFEDLQIITKRPEPFACYTAEELWTDEYRAGKMLEYHLDETVDAASRNLQFINASADWMIERFHLASGANVIDFGCGPGLYTLRFAKSGAAVAGLDFSKKSLAYAVEKAKEAHVSIDYIHGNYLQYQTSRKYDLITMIMCDYSALSPPQRAGLLRTFHALLKPGGSVILDVHSTHYFHGCREQTVFGFNFMDRFWKREDYYCFQNTFKYEKEKLLLDTYTVVTKHDINQFFNWFQCFDADMITNEFQNNGLTVTEFYSDVSGKKYSEEADEFAVIAKKT